MHLKYATAFPVVPTISYSPQQVFHIKSSTMKLAVFFTLIAGAAAFSQVSPYLVLPHRIACKMVDFSLLISFWLEKRQCFVTQLCTFKDTFVVTRKFSLSYPNLTVLSFCMYFQEATRREAMTAAIAAGAAMVPTIANAAAGESPRFSVFGLIGDGTAYSEGAAYGSDQSTKVYSPYSVYGEVGAPGAIYDPNDKEYYNHKKAILAESKKRLANLDGYIQKKKWFEVRDELTRYMYETRGAVRGLAQTPAQKKAAAAFFKAIEDCDGAARLKLQDKCAAGAAASVSALDAFVATL